jgi:hypothetical protein
MAGRRDRARSEEPGHFEQAPKRQRRDEEYETADVDIKNKPVINPHDSMRFDTRGLMQTAGRSRTVFSLVQGPTHLRKNADVIKKMIQSDETTQTAFGIGNSSSTLAFLGFSTEIAGITMLDPYRNRDVVARDANVEMFISFSRGTKNVVHSVCVAVAIEETGQRLSKLVRINARERITEGLDEDDEEEDEDEPDTRTTSGIRVKYTSVSKGMKRRRTAPPLLLYKATNLVLMNHGLASRAWSAIGKMTPGLLKAAEADIIETGYKLDDGTVFNVRRIDCCGVLNDILLTIQHNSLQHPADSAKGKLFNWTIELIANPSFAGQLVPAETIEFGRSLSKLLYLYGRVIED